MKSATKNRGKMPVFTPDRMWGGLSGKKPLRRNFSPCIGNNTTANQYFLTYLIKQDFILNYGIHGDTEQPPPHWCADCEPHEAQYPPTQSIDAVRSCHFADLPPHDAPFPPGDGQSGLASALPKSSAMPACHPIVRLPFTP